MVVLLAGGCGPGSGDESGGQRRAVDAGTWDGKGFRSTGLDFPDSATFAVTFTTPGTYPFACLIHPQMVGKLVVKP